MQWHGINIDAIYDSNTRAMTHIVFTHTERLASHKPILVNSFVENPRRITILIDKR